MKEKAVFLLPLQLDYAIWAATTLGNFLMDERLLRDIECSELVVQTKREFFELLRPFAPLAVWTEEVDKRTIDEADLLFDFNVERAMAVSRETDRHVVDGFGVLLGTELLEKLPLFLNTQKEQAKILYLPCHVLDRPCDETRDWPHAEKFLELAEDLDIDPLPEDISLSVAKKEIGSAAFCVGVAGSLTLLAAGMGKPVLELYPADLWQKGWQPKWQTKWYRMVYAPLNELDPRFVVKVLKNLISDYVKEMEKWGIHQCSIYQQEPTVDQVPAV